MNTRITFLLSFFCLTLLMSCATENADTTPDSPADTATVDDTIATKLADNETLLEDGEVHYNVTTDEKIRAMIREKFLPELQAHSRKEISSQAGVKITINPIPFKPNDDVPTYVYAQILFEIGDVTEDDFVLFYPDWDTGKLSAGNYVHISKEDRPCNICDMAQIRRASEKDPYGIFVDRQTTAVKEMTMSYNLAEAFIQWIDKE
jgi:hypothetical protein